MQRLIVGGAALIAVTYGLARFSLGLFVPDLRAEFALSATGAGWIMAGSFAGYVTGLLGAGSLVRRWGARAVALSGGVVAAAGTAGVAAAPHAFLLGLAATVGGVSTGLASPALAAAVEERLAAARRPAAQTAINAGTSLGLCVAVPVALAVTESWRAAWVVFALAAVAVTLGLARALHRPLSARAAQPGAAVSSGRPAAQPRLSTRLRLTAVLLGLSSAAFWAFGREVVETVSMLPPAVSRTAWLAAGVGGFAGAGAGALAARLGLRVALVAGWAPLAAGLGLLAVGWSRPVWALGLSAAFGAGYMALTGLLIVWSVQERPAKPAGAVASAFLVLAAGQIAGSPAAGLLADRFGLAVTFMVAAGVAALGVLALPSSASALGDPPLAHQGSPVTAPRGAQPGPALRRGMLRRRRRDVGALDACTYVRQRAG